MKLLLTALLIGGALPIFGDDMALAKSTFEKFSKLQELNDPKAADLISPECTGKMVQSNGEIEIEVDVPKGQFAKLIEESAKKPRKDAELYDDVEFAASGDTIQASGVINFDDPAFKGPFTMEFAKNAAGEMKITYMTITGPLLSTPIKGEGVFEFVMPGKWTPGQIKKTDNGQGVIFHMGSALGPGVSLAYFAFDDANKKPAEQDLKEFPEVVSGPIVKKLLAQGGKELNFNTLDLNPGNKDQGYFIRALTDPSGNRVFINGITIRGEKRMYVLQTIGSSPPNVKLWREVAKSFKEL